MKRTTNGYERVMSTKTMGNDGIIGTPAHTPKATGHLPDRSWWICDRAEFSRRLRTETPRMILSPCGKAGSLFDFGANIEEPRRPAMRDRSVPEPKPLTHSRCA